MTTSVDSTRLFRFMRLFGVNKIDITNESDACIEAVVGWEDDDTQNIRWNIQNDAEVDLALALAEFARDNGVLRSDKIVIPPEELRKRLNWDANKFNFAVNALLSLKVDMIDDGKPTDSFFIHF